MLTAQFVLCLHPFVERALFYTMDYGFSEHFGIISFIEIIGIDIAEFLVQDFGKFVLVFWRFREFYDSFVCSSDRSS